MADFSLIIPKLTAYNARFAHADFSTVRMWIDEGCDPDADIVPALERCMKLRSDIKSLNYFTAAVRRQRDERLAKVAAAPPTREAADALRARHIAFVTRKLGKCLPSEERWLADYEQHHGEVLT